MLASTIQFSHNTTPTHNQPQPRRPIHARAQQEQPSAAPDTQQCTNTFNLLSRNRMHPPTRHHVSAQPSRPAAPPSRRCNHDPRVCLHPAKILFVAVAHSATSTTQNTTHNCGRKIKLLRKEVIQPHLPVRLPCYDFVPIADPTFDSSL